MLESSDMTLLFAALVLSAFYSGTEAALISIPIDRTKQLIEEGGKKGSALSFVTKYANQILITLLIGNNLVNIFAGSLTSSIAAQHLNSEHSMFISVTLTTVVIVLLGEILPKTFARGKGEALIIPISFFVRINYFLFYPLVTIANWIVKSILGKNAELNDRLVTTNDIEYLVNKAVREKSIDAKQTDLLSSVLEFPTIKVKDIMIPRKDIQYLSKNQSFNDLIAIVKEQNHSRYPVCDGDLDKTIGLLHVKDLVHTNFNDMQQFSLERFLKKPFFVYEHMKIHAIFDHMNRRKVHMAMVKDENGLIVGIVTLEDIIEEIFGEIHDEHDEESIHLANQKAEGLLVDASISLRDLYNNHDIKIELNDNYSTLAGFLLDRLGDYFPKQGMMLFIDGFCFKLEKVENAVIIEVRIQIIDKKEDESGDLL